ncbi:hypothetical protein HS7_00780 [Sulfolobales archaeon HS-7]|nr:hypothetical protein HS7_00780 [Sulfolobales archaeon HS-7]
MLLALAVTLTSLIGIALSSFILSRGIEALEESFGQGTAGGLILGFIESLPETIVVIEALALKSPQIAIGASLGGSIILFTLMSGIVVLSSYLKERGPLLLREDYKTEAIFNLGAVMCVLIILFFFEVNLVSGVILIAFYLLYSALRIKRRKGGKIKIRNLIQILIAVALTVVIAPFFLSNLILLSTQTRIPLIWLSLVISPIGADVEELINGLILALMGKGSIAIVSFLGAKLENFTLLLGFTGLFYEVNLRLYYSEVFPSILFSLIFILLVFRGKIGRIEGVILILLYFLAISIPFL